jgi:hypothetical protein
MTALVVVVVVAVFEIGLIKPLLSCPITIKEEVREL